MNDVRTNDQTTKDDTVMRSFDTGATRDTAEGKLDFEGFLSPAVLKQFAKYMNMNRMQSDGRLRDSDNWQKGIPQDAYMKSGYRHFYEWWAGHRYGDTPMIDRKPTMAALCGLLFNVMGYMHEELKRHPEVDFDGDDPTPEMKERQENFKARMATFLDTDDPENIKLLQDSQDEEDLIEVPELPVCFGKCGPICGEGCPDHEECNNLVCDDSCEFEDECQEEFMAPVEEEEDLIEEGGDTPENCHSCLHFEKLWDEWPCRCCRINTVDLLEEGPFKNTYFCSREGLDDE
jgi:hypothetical protein